MTSLATAGTGVFAERAAVIGVTLLTTAVPSPTSSPRSGARVTSNARDAKAFDVLAFDGEAQIPEWIQGAFDLGAAW